MSRVLAFVVICVALSGCLKPDDAPGPSPDPTAIASTIDGLTAEFNSRLRSAYLQGAVKLRSKDWKTVGEYLKGQTDLIDSAFDAAAQPLADREQREAGAGWTPERQASYLETIAGEHSK